jgi:hypothetical protein
MKDNANDATKTRPMANILPALFGMLRKMQYTITRVSAEAPCTFLCGLFLTPAFITQTRRTLARAVQVAGNDNKPRKSAKPSENAPEQAADGQQDAEEGAAEGKGKKENRQQYALLPDKRPTHNDQNLTEDGAVIAPDSDEVRYAWELGELPSLPANVLASATLKPDLFLELRKQRKRVLEALQTQAPAHGLCPHVGVISILSYSARTELALPAQTSLVACMNACMHACMRARTQ